MTPASYYQLKAAQALFSKDVAQLSPSEHERIVKVAQRYVEIEGVVLGSGEASGVCVSDEALTQALDEIRGRYETPEAFAECLAGIGLDESSFSHALQRDLMVEAVMNRVGSRAGQVDRTEAEIFYLSHRERFSAPERRKARHILVTINDEYAENTREAAGRRARQISERVQKKPERFGEQALKHSECPTALNEGVLGNCVAGQLLPELDAALFQMKAGEISPPIETELGFHVLFCEEIQPAGLMAFDEVCDSLCSHLTEERARKASQAWLKALLLPARAA